HYGVPVVLLSGSLAGDLEGLRKSFRDVFPSSTSHYLWKKRCKMQNSCSFHRRNKCFIFGIPFEKRGEVMEGFGLIVLIVIGVLFIVFATAKLKLHPFISLIVASFGVGIGAGLPLMDVVEAVNGGFAGLMGNIGLVIVFGTIIGVILEKSGAALRMAEVVLRVVGEKRPQMAMSLIGAIVSIPVFCDSGFVILSSLKKALAKRAKVAVASMAIALST